MTINIKFSYFNFSVKFKYFFLLNMKIFNCNLNLSKKFIILILIISVYIFYKLFIITRLYKIQNNERKKKIQKQKQEQELQKQKINDYNNLNKIIYVNPNDAFIQIINSGYLKQFNDKDMEIRHCNNYKSCKKLYENNLIEFNDNNKEELRRLIKLCNEKLIKYKSLYNIPWKLCKTTTKLEEGMPHTHTDIIFLSETFFKKLNDNSKIVTLIHEKLHIYQRIYKEKTQKLYNNFNFSKVPKKNINLRRTNPDLDSFDYNYNGVLIYSEYQDDAKKLSDVDTKFISLETDKNKEIRQIENLAKQGYQNEHPNEIFASIISDKITKDELDKIFINYIN